MAQGRLKQLLQPMLHPVFFDLICHANGCMPMCSWLIYLGFPESWLTLIQVGLDFAHNLRIRQRHEGIGVVKVCCNDCACLCFVLILPHTQHKSVPAAFISTNTLVTAAGSASHLGNYGLIHRQGSSQATGQLSSCQVTCPS